MPDLNPIDLEQQIRTWREGLIQQEVLGTEDLKELEQHLRDSLGRLKAKGLSEEEAFLLATHRLGTPTELATEYAKVACAHVWTRRVCWMLSGYLLIELLARGIGTTSLIVQAAVVAATGNGYGIAAVALSAVVWLVCWIEVLRRLYRSAKSSSTVIRWLEQLSSPGLSGVVVSLLLFLATFRGLGSLVVMWLCSLQTLGEMAIVRAYTGPVISLLLPIAVLGLLLSLRKRLHAEQAELVQ